MNKSSLKIGLFVLGSLLFTNLLSAQGSAIDLNTPAQSIGNQVKQIMPIVFGIGFLVACGFNMKHFFGDGGDVKKGIINIVLFAIIIGIMYGLARWVFTQSL
jgi:hypothetical protein